MRIRTLVLMIVLISGISRGFGADGGVVAKNGDRFSLRESTDASGWTAYELHRTSPSGQVTTLWRNAPYAGPLHLPKPSPLFISSVSAIYEGDGEISLLLREGETDGLVFRLAATANKATPIRVRRLKMYGDNSRGLRFKQHGELILIYPRTRSKS